MDWILKLPSNGDGTTDFADKFSLDSYSNNYGNDSSRGLLRFGLTANDMKLLRNSPSPQANDRVFIRFNSYAKTAWRLRIVSEWKIVDFRVHPDKLPSVDADKEVIATVNLKKVRGIQPLPAYPRYIAKGQPGLLTHLDEENRKILFPQL